MRRWILPFVSLTVLLPGAAGAQNIEESECRIGMRGGQKVLARCATLSVPANPLEPDGTRIELAVARIPALSANPLPDPLVMIQGGPGGSSIDLYLTMRNVLTGLRRNRDIIVMDQRGTGRSAAGLECESPRDTDFQLAAPELIRELINDCLASISADPRHYTTSLAVQDLEALRAAYGIEAWNVYGVSYGTRVTQHYMRRFPERVRSVVLDGSVPAPTVVGPHIPPAAQSALDQILARCRQDSACSENFGDVGSKFAEVIDRLEAQDIRVGRVDRGSGETEEVELSAAALIGLTRMMSYSSATAALLPLTIDEAHAGRYGTLLDQAELVLGGAEQSLNIAMHNTVICSEDWPRYDAAHAPDAAGTYIGSDMIDALEVICESWPSGPVDDDFSEPLRSELPVLFISGGADPATPAELVEEIIAGGVSNSLHIVAEQHGHGVLRVGCIPRIAEAFINAASVDDLDTSCIEAALPMPFFLTPAGPAP